MLGNVPELPEVETIRRGLAELLPGRRVRSVEVLDPKVVIDPDEVIARAVRHRVSTVDRRGKIVAIGFGRSGTILAHPKMTGQVVVTSRGRTVFVGGHPSPAMLGPMPHFTTRAVFAMDRALVLYFNDGRRFGWIRPSDAEPFTEDSTVRRLGPEPLGPDFTLRTFRERLERHSRAQIKAVLLDQTVVAGIGNIYADESLHAAGVHPARRAGSLGPDEVRRLRASIRRILAAAVASGGTSFKHSINEFRERGDYLERSRVFRREGNACRRCGSTIVQTVVAGRTTRFCPTCQPALPAGAAGA